MRSKFLSRLFVCAFVFAFAVWAPSAYAITISPILLDYEIAEGDTASGVVHLMNDTNQRETYTLSVENFIAKDEEGGQAYIQESVPTGLASWVRFNQATVTLDAGEQADFPFVIFVPQDAEPGGHYATIFFSRGAGSEQESSVGVSEQAGVLLLVNVPGNVTEGATVESFRMPKGKVLSHLPAEFELRIRNTGSVHIRPRGDIVLKNTFGSVVARVPVNPKGSAVLPNSIRRVDSGWVKSIDVAEGGFIAQLQNEWKNFAIGRYTAKLDAVYGAEKKPVDPVSVSFWVFPWRTSLIIVVLLVAIFFFIRGYNRMLVNSVMKKTKTKSKK